MIIGIPKEIKNHEYRVGMTPAGVELLVSAGHTVYVEKGAGMGSGLTDDEYSSVGAKFLDTPKEIFDIAEMIIKVKEPLEPELKMLKKETLLVRMPEEYHGWRRPSHRLLQQLYLMEWFEKYMVE